MNLIGRMAAKLRLGPSVSQFAILESRVTELEREVDELRRDSLRVAELTDLVEQALLGGEELD